MADELRNYQDRVIEQAADNIRAGNYRFVIYLPTGAGKTHVGMNFVRGAIAKNNKSIFACDRRVLVNQTSERFGEQGLSHGVRMSGSTFGWSNITQIVSQQTIEKMGFIPDARLLIIDECHTRRKFFTNYIKSKPEGVVIIGLSATPFPKGIGDIYDGGVISATTHAELVNAGWLVPERVYACTTTDITQLETGSNGEWKSESVAKQANVIIGDVIDEWIKNTHAEFGRPVKTLLFGPTVAYCEEICEAFRRLGYDFRTTSFRDDEKTTTRLINQFKNDEFIGLACVNKLVKGFDVADVRWIIVLRNLQKSFVEWIQMVGRGARPFPGKEFFGINDHTGNYLRFYHDMERLYNEGVRDLPKGEVNLEKKRGEMPEREKPLCRECGIILTPGQKECPACGAARPRPPSNVSYVPGKLEKIEAVSKGSRKWREWPEWVWGEMLKYGGEYVREYGSDPERMVKFAVAQYKQMYDEFPPFKWGRDLKDGYCDDRVRRAIRQQSAQYRQKRNSWKDTQKN